MPILVADPAIVPVLAAPNQYRTRTVARQDVDALAHVYFESYEPGIACDSFDAARADIVSTFDGDYGPLWIDASWCALDARQRVVAAVLTVQKAPWDDVPPGPFIVELFTLPDHRRQGLAAALVCRSAVVATAAGAASIGLRVASENQPALATYRSLGFRERSVL